MNLTREIQDTIKSKKTRQDKYGKDFLILELEKGESVFVFNNKETPKENWDELSEGKEYLFTVKEGNKFGTNILTYFEKMDFIV